MLRRITAPLSGLLAMTLLVAGCGGSAAKKDAAPAQAPASGSQSAAAPAKEPVKAAIAVSTWVGFAPLVVAQEKGFFKNHGLDLDVQVVEKVEDRRTAMAANRLQGFATTVETHIVTAASGIDVVQVLALDGSNGGDGIVAKKEIKSLKDLKGKKVALQTGGGASFFFMSYLLNKEGMSLKDIDVQSMNAGDAGAAFVAGKVDAAVTWEPWLSKAKATDFGSVLVSSAEKPGLIVDTVGLRKDFVQKNPDAVKALAQGWFEAVDLINNKPDEAYPIMAKFLKIKPEEMKNEVAQVKYYGKAENQTYLSGQINDLLKVGGDLFLEQKVINKIPDLKALVDASFVK